MIKLFFAFSLFILALSSHTSQKEKRVYFYSCHLERKAQDEKKLKEDFVFQITKDRLENKEKKSLRWAEIEISLLDTGHLQILISEIPRDGGLESHRESYLLPQFSIDNPTPLNKSIIPNFSGDVRYFLSCR